MCRMLPHSAPFDGDRDWILCGQRSPDVEAFEMRLPCGMIGKPCQSLHRKPWMTYPSQGTPAHLVRRRFVDDIVCVSGAQRIEVVNPAVPRRRKQNLKPGLGSCPWSSVPAIPVPAGLQTPRRSNTSRLFACCEFRDYGSFARLLEERREREDGERAARSPAGPPADRAASPDASAPIAANLSSIQSEQD